MTHHVEIVTPRSSTVAVTRFHLGADGLPGIGERLGAAFGTVSAELGRAGIAPHGPAIACYEPRPDGLDVAAGFQVAPGAVVPAPLERIALGDVDAAHTTHLGSYLDLPEAYADLRTGAEEQGRTLTDGSMWEEYWSEPGTPESQTRTEIYWPLAD